MLKIQTNKKGELFYTICAKNGRTLHNCEGLVTKANVLKNIAATKKALEDGIILDASGKFPQFKQVKPKKTKK